VIKARKINVLFVKKIYVSNTKSGFHIFTNVFPHRLPDIATITSNFFKIIFQTVIYLVLKILKYHKMFVDCALAFLLILDSFFRFWKASS
jgi:hypothetical protein